jgi:hypothetical protein
MVDGDSFEPVLNGLERDMAETICKLGCSLFYFSKDTFDSIPISMSNDLKSIAVFSEN